MSSNSLKRESKSTAEKFATLFDNDWQNQRSTLRQTRHQSSASYNPAYSWNARSIDPKLDRITGTVNDTSKAFSRPIGLSGSTVVPLEPNQGLEVFNVPKSNNNSINHALTTEQEVIGMNRNPSGVIGIVEQAKRLNKVVIADHDGGFINMDVKPPTFTLVDPPKGLVEAGSQCDKKLLTPAQRLEIQEYERKKDIADKYIAQSLMDRNALNKKLHGPEYKRGLIGIDSCDNAHSKIYGDRAIKTQTSTSQKEHLHQQRHEMLANRTSSILTSGNILVPETLDPNKIKTAKLYQSKGGEYHGKTFAETSDIFRVIMGKIDKNRQQYIRNQDIHGKSYNIITHAAIEQWPATDSDRPKREYYEHRVLSHPSQTSLEGSRNLQGSLRPY